MQPWKVSVGLTASITAPAAILIGEDLEYLKPYWRAVLDTHWRAITFYGGFAVLTVAFFFYAAARALGLADLGRKVDLVERTAPGIRATATVAVALASPSLKRQEFIDLEEQARKRGLGLWNRAKRSARNTDSVGLPAELARQHRSLWQGAVCTLRAAIHSPALALSFQVAGLRTLR